MRCFAVEFPVMTSSRPPIVRLLGGSGAVIVFLIALLASLGAALGAPLGMQLVRRWARRRDRRANRIASLFGAVAACTGVAAVIWGLFFALMPRPSQEQFNAAMNEAQSQPAKLPAWYTKIFPQAARTDSASKQLMQSPGFVRAVIVMTVALLAVFLGVIGGALGWCADMLLGFARSFDGDSDPPVSLGPS